MDKKVGNLTASQISDFDTEVSNNTNVADNTTHRTSDGTDHTYINQDGRTTASPTHVNITSSNSATAAGHVVRLDQMNSAIAGLHWQKAILDKVNFVTSEPVTPTLGDRYINTATGNSSGTTQAVIIHRIYEWNNVDWTEYTPVEGWTVWDVTADTNYTFNGTTWVEFGSTVSHNNTTGLQGGTTAEYYHLTSAQHADVPLNTAYRGVGHLPLAGGTLTGDLGIGISPSAELHVQGDASSSKIYLGRGNVSSSHLVLNYTGSSAYIQTDYTDTLTLGANNQSQIYLAEGSLSGTLFGSWLLDQNTNAIALNIDSEATSANVVQINSEPSSGIGIKVTSNSINGYNARFEDNNTNGGGYIYFQRPSSSYGYNVFSRNMAEAYTSSAVLSAIQAHSGDNQPALKIQQDGTGSGIFIDQNGAGNAIEVSHSGGGLGLYLWQGNTTSNAAQITNTGTGNGLFIAQNGHGMGLNIDQNGSNLGFNLNIDNTVSVGFQVFCDSIYTASTLGIFDVYNTSSTANVLTLRNNGTGKGLKLDQNGNGTALEIDSEATNVELLTINGVVSGSSHMVDVTNAGLHLAGAGYAAMKVRQTNTSTTADVFQIENEGTGIGIWINQDGNGTALEIDSESTGTQTVQINSQSDGVYSGFALNKDAGATGRGMTLVQVAGGAQALYIENAGTNNGIFIDQNGNGIALNIDSEATTAYSLNITNAGGLGIDMNDNAIIDIKTAGFNDVTAGGSKTANFNIDYDTAQSIAVTLTANTMTATLQTPLTSDSTHTLYVTNGGLATLTWAAESGSVKWVGGTAPTLTSSGLDIITFKWDGTNWHGVVSLDFS